MLESTCSSVRVNTFCMATNKIMDDLPYLYIQMQDLSVSSTLWDRSESQR